MKCDIANCRIKRIYFQVRAVGIILKINHIERLFVMSSCWFVIKGSVYYFLGILYFLCMYNISICLTYCCVLMFKTSDKYCAVQLTFSIYQTDYNKQK